jgi:hypothetical protein
VQFDGQRASLVSAAPLLDEHGGEIRTALSKDKRWPSRAIPVSARRVAG